MTNNCVNFFRYETLVAGINEILHQPQNPPGNQFPGGLKAQVQNLR
ncbi:hypothetical protein ACE1B6_27050 [Aerosakkonemataceae cyanobacterium BLCC-F154]|uniref:Uncharacterized protein n=1 Tax=Floridaenema fluviatile BLCC-F154 TaxID=3153640 RepID=A0ABV4YJS5_9CYAN